MTADPTDTGTPPRTGAGRLVRSAQGRRIAGVAAGLAGHLGVDPLLVRVAFIGLSFAGGLGVLLYAAGWLLIPEEDGTMVLGRGLSAGTHGVRAAIGLVLLVIAIGVLNDSVSVVSSGLLWGAVLVGVGVLLLVEEGWHPFDSWRPFEGWRHDGAAAPPAPASAAPAVDEAAAPAAGEPAAVEPDREPAPSWAVRPRRPRSLLGWVTVACALLAVGVAALLDTVGAMSVSPPAALGVVLVVIGAGLVVGTWVGRSRGLIAIGIALLPFAAGAALVREPLDAGTGDRLIAPASAADLAPHYQLTAGRLLLDLSRLTDLPAQRATTAELGFGSLEVTVPASATVEITAHAGAGHLDILGHHDDGLEVDYHALVSGSSGGALLRLDLSAGMGQVRVVRSTAGGL